MQSLLKKESPASETVLRMSLNMGGDDITEFLYILLDRISFPYRDIDLARWYDWNVMEDLKARLCTLAEVRHFLHVFTSWQGDGLLHYYREMWHSIYMILLFVNPENRQKNTVFGHMTKSF